jgi:hypothetical protein
MYVEHAARPLETPTAVGGGELAEGLMLLNASTLKIIRLQLAIERHDRQVALGAVDDLVALDRKLQDYLERVPASPELSLFRRELDVERAALNQEKLTLAAEVLRRPADTFAEREFSAAPAPHAEAEDDWLASADVQGEPAAPRGRWLLAILAIAVVALIGIGAAVWFAPSDVAAWLATAEAWAAQALAAVK